MIQANKIYRLYDILSYLIFYGINNKYPFLIIEEKLCKSEFIKSLENNNASIYLYRQNLQHVFKDVYGEDITINDITKTNPISMWVSEAYIRLFYKFHKTFHYLFLVIHLDKAISLFSVYHEMDYEQLYELFIKLQNNFKLLNALIDEKNITIRQLSLLSSISEHTLYNYSKRLYYDNFSSLGNSFKHCINLDEVFDLLKKILSDETIKISFNNTTEINSDYKLKMLNNGDLTLILTIPLLTGKSEIIEIQFNKKQKDSVQQFEKLKKKYCSLKRMIYNRSANTLENDEKNFIESLIKEIES